MIENKNKKSKYVFVNTKEEKVLEFFNELFGIEYLKIENEYYIYKLVEDEELELEEIIDSLNVEVGGNIKIFETNYINNEEDLYKLLDIYKKNNKHAYSNISILVMDLVNKSHEDLKTLRDIALYKIDNDNDLINIIIAMYKNDLNVSKTAASVYMHRNTVNNKLEIIKKTSGMDVQKFYDAIAMYTLMYIK